MDRNFSEDNLLSIPEISSLVLRWSSTNCYKVTKISFKYAQIVEELVAEEASIKLGEIDSCKQMNFRDENELLPAREPIRRSIVRRFKENRCWNCGKIGHLQANCFSMRKSSSFRHYRSPSSQRYRSSYRSSFYQRQRNPGRHSIPSRSSHQSYVASSDSRE